MAQESRLAVTIDSRGAKRNADDLTGSLQDMTRAGDAAASSADGVSSSLDDQRKELSQLLGQINPTVAALGRLDDMQEKLAKFKGSKFLDAETFDEYNQRINTLRQGIGESAEGMNKAGMSAKAYQAALRGVPAQFTDIAVSLQGGQAPLTVLLQQGGQLKDMFGGIGPAARALGGYVAGLVNPFTVAAAAAGVLALAYYQGSEESERFANALIENGNAAGTSANQLADMANQVAATSGTVGAAADVLTKLASAGNPLTSMYVEIPQASLSWSKQTGRNIDDVVKSFNDIAKGPVEAIKKLDGELNILTASEYANIVSLQEQGKTMDAARLAASLYAEEINGRAAEIERNLGDLESAWQTIAGAAKKAWDSMLDVGREQTIEDQIANTEKILAGRKEGFLSYLFSEDDSSTKFLENKLKQLQNALATNNAAAAAQANENAIQSAGKKAVDSINATFKASQTQTEKLQKQLKDIDKARTDAVKAGAFTADEEVKYAAARKNIEQQIADIKTREAKKNAPKNVNRGVAEAVNTFSRLYGQYDPAAQAARALTKEQEQLDLALKKGKISQDEYGKALAQASINYAAVANGAKGLAAAEQYRAQINRKIALEREGYQVEAKAVGMGDVQAGRYRQTVALESQMNEELLTLQSNLTNAQTAEQKEGIRQQIQALRDSIPARRQALQDGFVAIDQEKANPFNGWTASLQNFQTQAADVAGQTQSLFTNAFGTISSGVGSAFEKMALDGQTFGESVSQITRSLVGGVINSLGQMAAQWAVNQALQLAFDGARQASSAAEIARITAETTARTASIATTTTAKVAADGITTASSLTATATTTTAQVAAAGTTLAAWLPAALVASVGTFGAAAIVGGTALLAAFALIKGFSTGGYVSGSGTGTSDSIPARLSNGEFVVNAKATARNRELLEAINSNERVSFAGENLSVSASRTNDSTQSQKSGMSLTVNLIEDKANAGRVSQSTTEDGANILQICVASIMGDGEMYQAISNKFGMQGVGS